MVYVIYLKLMTKRLQNKKDTIYTKATDSRRSQGEVNGLHVVAKRFHVVAKRLQAKQPVTFKISM